MERTFSKLHFRSFSDPIPDRVGAAVHIHPDREAVHTREVDEIGEVSKFFINISIDHSNYEHHFQAQANKSRNYKRNINQKN